MRGTRHWHAEKRMSQGMQGVREELPLEDELLLGDKYRLRPCGAVVEAQPDTSYACVSWSYLREGRRCGELLDAAKCNGVLAAAPGFGLIGEIFQVLHWRGPLALLTFFCQDPKSSKEYTLAIEQNSDKVQECICQETRWSVGKIVAMSAPRFPRTVCRAPAQRTPSTWVFVRCGRRFCDERRAQSPHQQP